MSATYVVCGSCGADSSQSAEAIRHKPNCPRMTATPSQEWTPNDEKWLQHHARDDEHMVEARAGSSILATCNKYAREINRQRDEVARLRAENERLTEWQSSVLGRLEQMPEFRDATWAGDKRGWGFVFEFVGWMHREIKSLRSQLAATREGETPK